MKAAIKISCLALFFVPVVAFGGPQSTVKIKSPPKRDAYGRTMQGVGTGTAIAYTGGWTYILTNHHVCPVRQAYTVEHLGKVYNEVVWVASDAYRDLALIKVRTKIPTAKIARVDPPPYHTAEHWGHPNGGPTKLTQGYTLGYTGRSLLSGASAYQIYAVVFGGESGSGIFQIDSDELYAVISESTNDGRPIAFAVGTTDIRHFLRQQTPLQSIVEYDTKANQSYVKGIAEARDTGKPLVTFVGIEACPIEGAITCAVEKLEGYTKGTVIVSVWNGNSHVGKIFTGQPESPSSVIRFAQSLRSE